MDEVDSMQPHESVGLRALAEAAAAERIDRRVFFRRAAALGLSFGAAAAFLAACSSSSGSSGSTTTTGPSSQSATLAIGPIGDSGNYDPATNNWDAPYPPFPSIYEGLTTYDPPRLDSGEPPRRVAREERGREDLRLHAQAGHRVPP